MNRRLLSTAQGFISRAFASCVRGAFLLVLFPAIVPAVAHAQSASAWNKRGQAAEVRQDYDTAYEDYRNAHQASPKDMRYTTRFERMKFQAGASHVDRGRVLRQSGDLAGAINEFTRALQIDPSNEAANQELHISQNPGASAQPLAPAADQSAAMRDIDDLSGAVVLKPVSNDPITLNMVEDVKNIYQTIGQLAGLNVLFDPDYNSKRIAVDLKHVSLSEALHIVGILSGAFYTPVTSDTIYVAQNSPSKHTDLDEQETQVFYLTNASQQSDANDVLTAIRNLLDPQTSKINLVPSQNALVVRSTPDQLVLVEKLLNDLDRAKPEVVVDVAILEVNRDKIRNLGITLPQSFGLTPQASSTTNTSTSTTTTSTAASNFTLNTLANLNATNLAVSVSGGTINALLSDADTRVLQNPRIRATDGQRATLKIGSKIPVATGSYSAGAATGVTAGIGVQTQFTYLDVGVNIDMTPTVHYDHDVSIKMRIEVSSQTGSVTISGVTEPIIGQRVSEQTIQLKEGEPSILAGIFTKQDNNTSSGTPGLGEIPLLKYFFGSQYKENQQDEIVFLLIPHIVRESVLTRLNTRAIDTGTSKSIELRHDPNRADALLPAGTGAAAPQAGSPTSAANAAAAMVQQMKQAALPPTPPNAGPMPVQPGDVAPGLVSGAAVSLSVQPADAAQTVGSTFQTAVMIANATDLFAVPIQVQFDPKILQLVNVDAGEILSRGGEPVSISHRDEGNGLVTISTTRPPGVAGVAGQGSVCTLTFKAIAPGDSKIALVKVGAQNSAHANLPATGTQAVVHVK